MVVIYFDLVTCYFDRYESRYIQFGCVTREKIKSIWTILDKKKKESYLVTNKWEGKKESNFLVLATDLKKGNHFFFLAFL